MSMHADIKDVIIETKNSCNLTDDQAINLFIDIIECLEWDINNVNYEDDDWKEKQYALAKKDLNL